MLHLIFQPLRDSKILERMAEGDCAVFLDNGVLCLMRTHHMAKILETAANRIQMFALLDDLQARGITASDLLGDIRPIDYAGLVELTVAHQLIQSWN